MFSFFGKKKYEKYKLYKEAEFSFSYPANMEMGVEGDLSISFFRKENPDGVFRMSKVLLKESGQTFDEVLSQNKNLLEEDKIKFEDIYLNTIKGIMYQGRTPFSELDKKFWPHLPERSSKPKWTTMEMRYWQLGNAKVYFYFSYRYPTEQSPQSNDSLEVEKREILKLLRSIKVR